MERRGAGSGGGGLGGLPIPGGKGGGIGAIVVLLIVLFLGGRSITGGGGGDGGFGLDDVLNGIPANQPAGQAAQPIDTPTESEAFIGFVLDDVQQTWADQFRRAGREYQNARLATFSNSVSTQRLRRRAVGRRAVLLPGGRLRVPRPELLRRARPALRRARRLRPGLRHRPRGRPPRAEPARHRRPGARGRAARPGRPERAVGAAGAAGRLPGRRLGPLGQRARHPRARRPGGGPRRRGGGRRRPPDASGRASPDSFTHGTSEQRARWFKRGFDSGDPQDCDTFAAGDL